MGPQLVGDRVTVTLRLAYSTRWSYDHSSIIDFEQDFWSENQNLRF